ncbi:efflux RND transporter periplasmic adaptor subunit [Longimicrobium sp.]|uniref:efflux RND transporter periplasmic adaptor subunit n=1 Tax=Longimicrobium sp. TaxID=2029185 RepID=UPI002E35B197|nr:efflux RND transporter periplasmic adaptor subunit [Longimicrobium sp.]HEX6037240.1 efflux RND transporter periplasmic adaptor subunit [Longimicrobium sp.]
MKSNWKKGVAAGAAVVILGAGGLAFGGNSADAKTSAAAPQTVRAQQRDLVLRAEASGEVEPIRTVEVKSKASGEILRVHVETGDYVEAGTLLAEVDPRDVQNALDQAEADLSSAQVQLRTARAQRQRVEALRESEIVTQDEYESAVNGEAAAQTQLVRAQTNARLARERSRDVTIRAPIAGTIITRAVEPGMIIASATGNVSGGTSLFTMADLSRVQVRARVDETDIGKVQPGQQARVTVEAYPGQGFTGTVLKVEPQAVVEQNVTMFPVLVRLENPEGLLKPGMNADVSMVTDRRAGAVSVPTGAVTTVREASTAAAALGLDAATVQAQLRPAGGSARGGQAAGGARSGAGANGARGGGSADGTTRGIVFVKTAAGPEPRAVTLGLSDWENVEVVRGVAAGEEVYLLSGALVQQQQTENAERMRQRMGGGVVPGAGGAPAGGGPRGG